VRLAGAANTLVFGANGIHADNTDGLGIVADITRNAGVPIAGRDVLLLGAGGAAAGALGSLLEQKPAASSWSTALMPRLKRWSSSMRPLPHYIK
jgi:shikimate 5-dehydrogenase